MILHYGLNKIKLAFDAKSSSYLLYLHTFLVALAIYLALALKMLALNLSMTTTGCYYFLISYNKFIKLQPFIIVFVDVLATAAAFIGTTVHQVVAAADSK